MVQCLLLDKNIQLVICKPNQHPNRAFFQSLLKTSFIMPGFATQGALGQASPWFIFLHAIISIFLLTFSLRILSGIQDTIFILFYLEIGPATLAE
jgi:hypothetical protein